MQSMLCSCHASQTCPFPSIALWETALAARPLSLVSLSPVSLAYGSFWEEKTWLLCSKPTFPIFMFGSCVIRKSQRRKNLMRAVHRLERQQQLNLQHSCLMLTLDLCQQIHQSITKLYKHSEAFTEVLNLDVLPAARPLCSTATATSLFPANRTQLH